MKFERTLALLAALGLVFAPSSGLRAAQADRLASFDGGAGWINSPALTPAQLQGKVVLVDFWEYTCINCLRTLPYLREWYRRYHDKGLVIVGVHTPEFHFSGERANVVAATKRLGVEWPVVLDDQFTIWKRYGNSIWPHEYLYDQNGKLVDSVEGEGAYQQTEAKIQSLLKSTNPKLSFPPVMALLPADSYDKPGAVCYPKTAEILIDTTPIANASAFNDPSRDTNYADTAKGHADGKIYLQGFWHATPQAVVSGGTNGQLALRYHAIQVMAVMKPEEGSPVRVDVTQDGKAIARSDAGTDIHYDGNDSYVLVDTPRSYDLVMNAHYGQHDLRLSPQRYGAGIYDFAFESCEVP